MSTVTATACQARFMMCLFVIALIFLQVNVDTQNGEVSVVGKRKHVDVLYLSVVDVLTYYLPDTIAWVRRCTVRHTLEALAK